MTPDVGRLSRIRWAVRATLVLGVAASVIANVLHAEPNPIAQTIAAWPPLALLLTIELIARVPVHRRGLAAVRLAATAIIAGIAAWVSYWHMAGVAARYGEVGAAPYLIPLSVDGLVVVASVCLVELAGRIRAAEIIPVEVPAEPSNPAAENALRPAEMADLSDTLAELNQPIEIDPEPEPDPAAERAARKAAALAKLADPDADPVAVAADARVTVETLRRWAIEATDRTRRPRGGPRKTAADRELVGAAEGA